MDKPLDEMIGNLCIDSAKKACRLKQYQQAEAMLEKLLQHTTNKQEAQDFAFALTVAGNMAISKRLWAEAVIFLRQAIAFMEFARGKNDLGLATLVTTLADCLLSQGKFTEAENLYEQALRIYQEQFGQVHASVALAMRNLSELSLAKGEREHADALAKKSQTILNCWLKDEFT
jgi:tetratricopeptide (TPR) repeat protein